MYVYMYVYIYVGIVVLAFYTVLVPVYLPFEFSSISKCVCVFYYATQSRIELVPCGTEFKKLDLLS